jgi:cell division protein ZapE
MQHQLAPLQQYKLDLKEKGFQYDPDQEKAIKELQSLYEQLIQAQQKEQSFIGKVSTMFSSSRQPVKGLYMWGGVGRGKTYLMDTFYAALPFTQKKRTHFHRFMAWIHDELEENKGTVDPLSSIIDTLSRHCRVICFDEFFVTDITDAMILANVLDALFSRGVSLVTTSNIEPKFLYRNGLQRERFLPAISLLENHTKILNVDGGTDFRLRALEQAEIYHSPLDNDAQVNMLTAFEGLAGSGGQLDSTITVNHREITCERESEGVLWITFEQLCDGPRSQRDYIELSKVYHTVLLDEVTAMNNSHNDIARRFINLVDEFYERSVKLIIAAEVPMESLYQGSGLQFEFQRTLSRLQEMQSHEYLAQQHLG